MSSHSYLSGSISNFLSSIQTPLTLNSAPNAEPLSHLVSVAWHQIFPSGLLTRNCCNSGMLHPINMKLHKWDDHPCLTMPMQQFWLSAIAPSFDKGKLRRSRHVAPLHVIMVQGCSGRASAQTCLDPSSASCRFNCCWISFSIASVFMFDFLKIVPFSV